MNSKSFLFPTETSFVLCIFGNLVDNLIAINGEGGSTSSSSGSSSSSLQASMQEFKLFETQSNFYMIGWSDSTAYTKKECYELLKRIHEDNKATGSLKLSQGSLSFGDHTTCGHRVYEVSKSEIISLRNSCVLSNIANSRDENRYKKLLCMVDLTKNFFFSYYFSIMRSSMRIYVTMRVVIFSIRKCLCGTCS
ncbi:SAC domain-containing protein [Raphanus sativus]|nr:SAC domain-containing protein [Raphanus sativus]